MNKYSLLELTNLPECSGLSEHGRCTRLNVFYCQGEGCTFKSTKEEERASISSAYQRLLSLDVSKQKQIARKYYGGIMPWNKESKSYKLKSVIF
ncbi:hypothetical protein [Clostridium cellulovorans]|uniref:Uncharacterized protein n=1 Tax=Clostridium cellulovorans (strain ATCC 35296 / DSM 3052 / OCM 3 / 743B) TaxID=573061 RepID=D9SUG0_CLOC7|nr:hypothetical protein [Clostridium cellulovorans]ADL52915.1 hypothetical protein Clocel_3229 [Clostridium cellulovorans 743B]